ncbi:hypothetical protein HRbin29_02353 [bacterium HR29]|jgi:hypothetical protein|nr:hypothetical protein HRbin29_02353 [bacterium HR29]
MRRLFRAVLPVAVACVAALPLAALADGEAGLVIDYGDGRVETYCVAFEGDRITGQELLERAGLDVNQFSGMVCAIDGVGCRHQGNFASCHCQCEDLSDCTYWAYFVQRNDGGWVYSSLGFQSQVARHGDLHGWRWGKGTAGSAPKPPPLTFADVCGGAGPSPTGSPPPASGSPAPPPTTGAGAVSPSPAASPASGEESPSPEPTLAGGFTPLPASPTAGEHAGAPELPSPTFAPAEERAPAGSDRLPVGRLAAFGGLAGALAAAIAVAALARRSRRGDG